MQLNCPTCGASIQAADINIEMVIAKCGACNAVFDFADRLYKDDPAKAKEHRGRPPAPLPEKFKITEHAGRLSITWRWFTPVVFFLLFFCIAWDSFLVFWYSMAILAPGKGGVNIIMLVFPIAHVAVGVGLTYFVIAMFLNRSVLEVQRGRLSVRHGPVPWKGNLDISTADITQLYCLRGGSGFKPRGRRRGAPAYEVAALLKDGRKRSLVKGLGEAEQALYLEQKLEEVLGIEDRPVAGEMPRS